MKNILSVFLVFIFAVNAISPVFSVEQNQYPLSTQEILIRDPFVLVHDGKYYMYGTGLKWGGYGCVVSEDLEHWTEPEWVFQAPEGFDGVGDWWAPECHNYNGSFYLFASYRSAASGKRGTAVFKSDSPLGPFVLISDGHITPKQRDCIDGTLYVDENGQPWIVYVGEWTSNEDHIGDMYTAMLSDDLSCIISEPVLLFRGTDAKWTKGKFTDGPFVYKTINGKLLMLWSCNSKSGYAVGIVRSLDNKMTGKWVHDLTVLYQKDSTHPLDGGHGMLFTDLNGQLMLAIHSPNTATEDRFESAEFIPVADLGFNIVLSDGPVCKAEGLTKFSQIIQCIYAKYYYVIDYFSRLFSSIKGNDS